MDNSYPIKSGEQDTFVDYENAGRLMISWDISRRLSLIPDVDKYRAVGSEKMDVSFDQLRVIQGGLEAGINSRCPRYGEAFDCRRGTVIRRID